MGHLQLLPDLVAFVVSRAWTCCEWLVLLWHAFDEELVGQPSRNSGTKPVLAKFFAGAKEFILSTIVVLLLILVFGNI